MFKSDKMRTYFVPVKINLRGDLCETHCCLTSGGDAQMNALLYVRLYVRAKVLKYTGCGFAGLVAGDIRKLNPSDVSDF